MTLNWEYTNFPNIEMLATALLHLKDLQDDEAAWYAARNIIEANDADHFDDAWNTLANYLTK